MQTAELFQNFPLSHLIESESNPGLKGKAAAQDAQQLGAQGLIRGGQGGPATGAVHVHRQLGQAPRGLGQLAQPPRCGDLEDLHQGEYAHHRHLHSK